MQVSSTLFLLISTLFLLLQQQHTVLANASSENEPCKPLTLAPNFNLKQFMSKPWYAHQQAPTKFVPIERNYCISVKHTMRTQKTRPWKYEILVDNYSADVDGNVKDGSGMCGTIVDEAGKLAIAPCFLPKSVAGPFWVLAYDEKRGYALVSGGQPTIRTEHGGCSTGEGSSNAGLWIYLRSRKRNEKLIKEIRDLATSMDIDVSVLNDVDQSKCDHIGIDSTKEL